MPGLHFFIALFLVGNRWDGNIICVALDIIICVVFVLGGSVFVDVGYIVETVVTLLSCVGYVVNRVT